MSNPFSNLLNRAPLGFTLLQKFGLTALTLLYCLSPIDAVPDLIPVLGWCDDGFMLYFLLRVWTGPTLPSGGGGLSGGAISRKEVA